MARRGEHSREEIRQMALDAAEAIVAREGYPGLSTRRIAAAIRYTVGTLYLVFENLDDLTLQVNGRTLDALYDWLRTHQDAAAAGAGIAVGQDVAACQEAILTLANAYIAYAEAETPRWSMLFEYVVQENEQPEWYLHKLGQVFGLVEAALRPLGAGDLETQRIARVLWASVHGICLLKIRQRMVLAGNQETEAMTRMLVTNFLRGLRG
ncbi:MAG: TetR/AcrR family transcriptional regulator [Candidatus Accumulibacter sp.]|jgi:AcrR family transcriptional regulator|nr:TetR/AcrR family transcriptional regulator [Accumulibacter sp.]